METIKTIGKRIIEFVFLVGVLAFAIIPQCNKTESTSSGVDTVYSYSTVIVDSTQHAMVLPPIIIHDTFIPMPIPSTIDTQAVIAAYLSQHVITREWRDSDLVVHITDTFSKNQLGGSLLTYKILRPCVSTTTVIAKPKPQAKYHFFTGVGTGYNGAAQLNISALFTTPKNAFAISNNLVAQQPNASLTAYFIIK